MDQFLHGATSFSGFSKAGIRSPDPDGAARGLQGILVQRAFAEHLPAVDEHLLDAEGLFLIRLGGLDLLFVKDGQVGKAAGTDVAAIGKLKAVCRRAGHAADGVFQGVAGAVEGVPEELGEAVVDGRVLHAEFLDPRVGHVQAVLVVLEIRNDLRRGVGTHVDAALEITLFAQHQVGVEIVHAFRFGNVVYGLALVLFKALADVGHLDVLEAEAQQEARGIHQHRQLQPVQGLAALLDGHGLVPRGQDDRDDRHA